MGKLITNMLIYVRRRSFLGTRDNYSSTTELKVERVSLSQYWFLVLIIGMNTHDGTEPSTELSGDVWNIPDQKQVTQNQRDENQNTYEKQMFQNCLNLSLLSSRADTQQNYVSDKIVQEPYTYWDNLTKNQQRLGKKTNSSKNHHGIKSFRVSSSYKKQNRRQG